MQSKNSQSWSGPKNKTERFWWVQSGCPEETVWMFVYPKIKRALKQKLKEREQTFPLNI